MLNPSLRDDWVFRPQALRPMPIAPTVPMLPIYPSPTMSELLLCSLHHCSRSDVFSTLHLPPPNLPWNVPTPHDHPTYFSPYHRGWVNPCGLFNPFLSGNMTPSPFRQEASQPDESPQTATVKLPNLIPFYCSGLPRPDPPEAVSKSPSNVVSTQQATPVSIEQKTSCKSSSKMTKEVACLEQPVQDSSENIPSSSPEIQDPSNQEGETSSAQETEETNSETPILVDVAACDGPVWFERVLNKHYQPVNQEESIGKAVVNERNEVEEEEEEEDQEMISNEQPPQDQSIDEPSSSQFFCKYCHHSFKNRSYYLRHVQRHANPTGQNSSKIQQELSVPFFPCKVCGCRFPSYYFVHKHRKTCHLDTEPSTS